MNRSIGLSFWIAFFFQTVSFRLMAQCDFDYLPSPWTKKILKQMPKTVYDTLKPGSSLKTYFGVKVGRDFVSYEGHLLVRRGEEVEFYPIGVWKSYFKGQQYEESTFDDCGNPLIQNFFGTTINRSGRIVTEKIVINQTTYKLYTETFTQNNVETYEQFVTLDNKKMIKHGVFKKTKNGEVIYDEKYHLGVLLKE